jgi:hypothetical protein
MAKYFTYEGKRVGLVRKMMDDVVLIEESWVNEVNVYLGKQGYDTMLSIVAKVLSAGGHPSITRAQAWIILSEVLNNGVPEVLQDANRDESSDKGNLFVRAGKSASAVVDTVTHPVGKVVGGSIAGVKSVLPKKKSSQVTDDVDQ